MYSGYGIAFDGKGSWGLNNDSARNVIVFGVDNSSWSHTDNQKNVFLLLGKGTTFSINEHFGSPEKKFNINLVKQRRNFIWVCIIMLIIVSYFWMEKKSINLKLVIKIITFHLNFV